MEIKSHKLDTPVYYVPTDDISPVSILDNFEYHLSGLYDREISSIIHGGFKYNYFFTRGFKNEK